MPHDQPHDHHHDDAESDHDHGGRFGMRLHTVRLYVGDFGAGFAFYRETLGLPLKGGGAAGPFALFALGGVQLALERMPPEHPAYGELVGRFSGLSIMVKDLAEAHRHLVDLGVEFMAPPQRQSWGGGIAHLRDPAGNIVSLVGRLDGA
jgi:catechol 2,3-dioxygenase-like lactoylglutathione lyase family enzyme